jgi:hypothetical protein
MGRIRPLESSRAERAIRGENVIRDSFGNRPGGVLTFRTIRFRQAPVNSVD